MTEPRRDTDATQHDTGESFDQLTVPEAAERLSLSIDALRMRIRRGTVATTVVDGKKRVLVPRSVSDETRRDDDTTPTGQPTNETEPTPNAAELVDQLRSEVAYLRKTLDAEIEARRRADHLVAGMIEERRELTAQVAALTAVAGEQPTEQRLVGDETLIVRHAPRGPETPQDAPEPARIGQDTSLSFWDRLRALVGRQ
jgi:hypothetical protein